MTRVVQLMAGAEHGGAEAFFTRLAIALQRAGQEQRLAIRPYPARIAALKAAGIAPVALPFRGGPFDFATRRGLRALLRDYRPQVVLSWMSRATSLCPRGVFVHVARLGGYYDVKYYRGCDHVIANTHGIAAWLTAQGWPADRVHYLPNFPTVAPALLAACDFLVVPSRSEPLGNTIVEAWAAERPVVATETAGPRELIAAGETGLLVPAEDADALALAMRRLAEDRALRARLAAAGHARYRAEFSEPRVVAAYQALFAKVAA